MSTPAAASSILDGWAFNIDGYFDAFNQNAPINANFGGAVQAAGFSGPVVDSDSVARLPGTGTLDILVNGAGEHSISAWIDVHLDGDLGPLWYTDESGGTTGGPNGTLWEIDEPGYGAFNSNNDFYAGSAYADTRDNALSGTNKIVVNNPSNPGLLTDVSLALGRTFL